MNFRPRQKEEPEINLIPFIDVLLVILIFLMLTTTYSKFTEVQLKLPVADTDVQRDYPKEIIVTVTHDGRYSVKGNPAQLAHGISVALYNTAFGLIVAIPSLIFWRYFRVRVDEYLLTLELSAERFVRHLNTLRGK